HPHTAPAGPDVRGTAARLPPPARLPAVHDLALVAERVRPEHRLLRLDQVLPLGEQLVVGVDHAAAERPAGQVRPRLLVLAAHPVTVPASSAGTFMPRSPPRLAGPGRSSARCGGAAGPPRLPTPP